MDHIIIDREERMEDDIEEFKLDCVDTGKNYTTAKIKLCRDPENDRPLVFYSQELARNFKNSHDSFSKRHLIKVFTPQNITAVADSTLENKFKDTILAHRQQISDYAPLTDIHSQQMQLFLDETTAEFLSDSGINIDGLSEDFHGIESVEATPFMADVSGEASDLKRELNDLRQKYRLLKQQIAEAFEQPIDPRHVSDDAFTEAMARENVAQAFVQAFLSLKEQINALQNKLGEINTMVYTETAARIRLPRVIEESDHVFLPV